MNEIISRKDYMAGKVCHDVYYGQFCNEGVKSAVLHSIGKARIKRSADKHFNDIPLVMWDSMAGAIKSACGRQIAEANGTGGISMSDCVCVAKAAARIIKEGE